MTQAQLEAQRCGLIPEDNNPEFFSKHLSAYRFARDFVSGKKVLEVGFGDGYGMNYLARAAAQVTGLDIAPDNIPLAAAKYTDRRLKFFHFDGYRIPFPDASFDAVCTFQVIEHIPEARLPEWLGEIKRVLAPDGRLFVSTLNLATAMKPGAPYVKHHDHEKEFRAPELEALLRSVFPAVEMHGLHYAAKHRFFKRLKKMGLSGLSPVKKHFSGVTTDDFIVSAENVEKSIDLYAVCRPQYNKGSYTK